MKNTIVVPLKKIKKAVAGYNLLDVLDSLCHNDIFLSYSIDESRGKLKLVVNNNRRIDIAMIFETLTTEAAYDSKVKGAEYKEDK